MRDQIAPATVSPTPSGNRISRVIDKVIGRRTAPGWFKGQSAIAVECVRSPLSALEVILRVTSPRQRPFPFIAPPVFPHDKDLDGRLICHPVVDVLQPVVKPAELNAEGVSFGERAKIQVVPRPLRDECSCRLPGQSAPTAQSPSVCFSAPPLSWRFCLSLRDQRANPPEKISYHPVMFRTRHTPLGLGSAQSYSRPSRHRGLDA